MPTDAKAVLKNYLQGARDTLVWKLEGLSERDQRLPRTPTGMNLLGIVKHALNTEVVYFGPTFARAWPTPEELVPAGQSDLQASWYATEQESAAGLVDLYLRVQRFADVTIDALPLDAIGHVEHWGRSGGLAPRNDGAQDRRPAAAHGTRRHLFAQDRRVNRSAAASQQPTGRHGLASVRCEADRPR